MAAIKRTPADIAFSKCIRERVNWTCENCGNYFPEGSRGGLDCSHFFGRGNWEIRFDPQNAEALCYGCHSHYGGVQRLDDGVRDVLYEKMQDRNLGRESRKTKGKGEIAKHYRAELKRMQEERACGNTGRIEFVGYF
jgi:hypothetical protein